MADKAKRASADPSTAGADDGDEFDEERFIPINKIGRLMRKAAPPNARLSKDGKELVQECVSEFIGLITKEASDKCKREKRQTINGDDIIMSMGMLGFDQYVAPLKLYLSLYRQWAGTGPRPSDQLLGRRDVAVNGDSSGTPAAERRDGATSGESGAPVADQSGTNGELRAQVDLNGVPEAPVDQPERRDAVVNGDPGASVDESEMIIDKIDGESRDPAIVDKMQHTSDGEITTNKEEKKQPPEKKRKKDENLK